MMRYQNALCEKTKQFHFPKITDLTMYGFHSIKTFYQTATDWMCMNRIGKGFPKDFICQFLLVLMYRQYIF